MKIKNKNRTIFDDYYNKSQLLLKKQEFQDAIRKFKGIFSDFGCHIPDEGFSTLQEFRDWRKQLAQRQVQVLKESSVGDPYFPKWLDEINKILKQFNLDDSYFIFIKSHIFFGTNGYLRPLFDIRTQTSENSSKIEVLLKIYPYTRKEDIVRNWSLIKKAQKQLNGYRERIKPLNLEEMLKIYYSYLGLKELPLNERKKKVKGQYGGIYETVATENKVSPDYVKDVIKKISQFEKIT